MLTEYLIRCGVILQFVPPGAATPEPLPINPPAAIRQIDYEQETQDELPELDEYTIQQLMELRESVGMGALPNDSSAADFEATLRAKFGGPESSCCPSETAPCDTVELLRATGERLDEIANQLERVENYQAADDLRTLAQRLRLHGRDVPRTQ